MTTTHPLTEVREHLIAALHADLVGPFLPATEDGEEAEEVLKLSPSRWYLTGFLAPARGRELEASDGSEDEELPAGPDENNEDAGDADPEPKRKNNPAGVDGAVGPAAAGQRRGDRPGDAALRRPS